MKRKAVDGKASVNEKPLVPTFEVVSCPTFFSLGEAKARLNFLSALRKLNRSNHQEKP